MGKVKILTGLTIAMAWLLVLVLPLIPAPVWADDVTYYPTEDTYIREDFDEENYGTSSWLSLCNDATNKVRTIIRIEDQSGGGNVTSVLLKLYYGDEFGVDAEGLKVRVYRCLEDAKELEATWVYWKDGWEWTSEGGDYTTLHYAEADMPEEGNWVTWNITELCEDAWITDEEDLYVIIRYKYETKTADPDDMSWSFFRSNEYSGTSLDPQVIVTYAEEVQTPEVDRGLNEVGSTTVKLDIYPTLYDWPSANVSAQVAPAGGAWTFASDNLTITDNNAVVRNVTGLTKNTNYVARARLTYASGTVYSSNVSFTTNNYDMPVWDVDVDDIEPTTATLIAGWTGNNDEKTVYARVYWKRKEFGTWEQTSLQYSSDVTEEFTWNITDLRDDWDYEYKGRFVIDGYIYWTDVEEFTTDEGPFLDPWVNDQDYYFFQLGCNYSCNDVASISLQARYKLSTGSTWTYSDSRAGLTGNGTEYFLFEDLLPAVLYDWYITATYDGGTSSALGSVWTASIDEYPEMTNMDATFISPNTIRVTVDGELNDVSVSALDPEIYVKYRPTWELAWQNSVDVYDVTGDGEWAVELICGDELLWDSTYDYYVVLDYTVGTNQTDADVFAVPSEPFAVETVEVIGRSGTTATFMGNLQIADTESAECLFHYMVQGSGVVHETATVTKTTSGSFSIDVTGLVYGEYYSFQAYATATDHSVPAVQGAILNFRAGYWDETVPPEGGDEAYDVYGRMWNWLANSTAGHWLILVLGMGILAMVFHKQRGVAVVMCLVVLGIGIVIGWVDTWVIVLLALGAGLTVWRFVTKRGGEGAGI